MKKIQYILLASLAIGAGASAASLPEEAAAMAEQFLSQKMGGKTADGGSLTAAVMSTSDKAVKKTKSLKKAEFYAYNAPQGGFVLMSANGDDLRVMGYSTDAGLSFDNMPEALQEWMVAYKAATASSDFSNSYPTPTVAPVAPLLKTKWGQGAPFNRKCPKYNGNPMLTGCTATAMAQILNYYKWNSKGYDVLEYVNEGVGNKEISVDFTKISYDWANMLDVYEEGSYTDAQADAVAQLMYEAGVSCKAKYDVTWSGSGATSAAIPYVGFNRYYDYNCEIWAREYVPTKLWMTVIQEELTAGRPILYSGYNGASGHAFVIDGIDAENNVHINWGWSGDADGYYDVTYCKAPDETRGYYCQQQMLVGLRPRTAADAPYAEGIKLIGFNQGNSYGTVTTNYYESDKNYTFTIGLMQNGVTKYIRKDYEYDKLGCYPYMNSGKEYGDWTDAAGKENPTFADGERGLLNPDAERQIITILPTEYANIPKIAATETQLPNSEYLPKGEQQTLNVPMTNTATADFKGAVKASFYCEKSGKYIEVEIPDVTIKVGESATVAVPVTFPENGVYTMQMNATSQQSVAAEKVGTTYVTAPNGSPLGYRIGVGESSVSAVKGVSLRVYPNPATESFRILGLEETSGVTVMSATGAVVVSTTADKDQSIDVSGLPTGVYFVKAGQNVMKFVKR